MKLLGALGVTFLALPHAAFGADRTSAWFTPALTIEAAPICGSILQAERNRFFSPDADAYAELGFKKIREMYQELVADPDVEAVGDGFGQLMVTPPGQQRVFTYFRNNGGCGGACETEQVLVSNELIAPPPTRQHTFTGTNLAPQWTLYKAADGDFYVLGIPQHRLHVYRITSPSRFELQCEVQLKPEKMDEHADPALQRARQATKALLDVRGAMTGGGGYCGSSQADWRWSSNVRDTLDEALYRPWGVVSRAPDVSSENSWGHYDRIESYLGRWSLAGIAEHRAFQRFLQQKDETTATLVGFYREKFGWPAARSTEVATKVVRDAIGVGFGFYSYDPFPRERQLRQAILERQPLSIVKTFEMHLVGEAGESLSYDPKDSILNVAVEYPEALQYLLSKGVDPNSRNAFGKTPLMYAAQYNQLESVKLLLAAGADPNAATFVPEDRCRYVLKTSGMTTLHYAARYASAPLIQLLVAQGAATFSAAHRGEDPDFADLEYPLDWLKKYTGDAAGGERNTNVTAVELPALLDVLRVPDRPLIAASWVTQAQSHYARGEFEPAYRRLRLALSAHPENAKALADLPLMALRAGHIDAAIEAANRAIGGLNDAASQAAAWFNKGLACEQQASMPNEPANKACDTDWIRAFATAWKLHPTPARANKLKQFFNKDGVGACASDRKIWSLRTEDLGYGSTQRIYVFHRADDSMDLRSARGAVRSARETGLSVSPRIVDRFVFDADALTVLENDSSSGSPLSSAEICLMPMIDPSATRR